MNTKRWFHVGEDAGVRDAVAAVLGAGPATDPLDRAAAGDLVVVESFGDFRARPESPGGHAFSLVRALKDRRGPMVFVVVRKGDTTGRGVARFCLADGSLAWDGRKLDGVEELAWDRRSRPRRSVDELLAQFEAKGRDAARSVSAVQRLAHWEREEHLMHQLQDPATGLFDGPYAALKIDEEFKRASRFQLPLSLVLLDIGTHDAKGTELPAAGEARQALLADVASVFLNESRDIDVLSRFTETVFLFLLPGTGTDGAAVLARRMLAGLRAREFAGHAIAPYAGIATVPSAGLADRRAFLAAAEVCLRRAQSGAGQDGLCTNWE